MIGKNILHSPINIDEVNSTFNERFKWAKYSSIYHPATTTYYWNKYNRVTNTIYQWNKWNSASQSTYKWEKWNAVQGVETYGSLIQVNIGGTVYDTCTIRTDGTTTCIASSSNPGIYLTEATAGRGVGKYANTSNGTCLLQGFVKYSEEWVNDPDGSGSSHKVMTFTFNAYRTRGGWKKGELQYANVSSSTSSTAYPNGGRHTDGYWYCNRTVLSTTYSKGSTSYGTVSSSSSTAYPTNGRHTDGYWYDGRTSSTSYSKGSTSYGTVSSASRSAYPDNNYSGSYWYVYNRSGTSAAYYSKGDYVEDVKSVHEDEFPENGRHTDGYWYVRI